MTNATATCPLPRHLHAAHEWTASAGKLDELSQLSGHELDRYFIESVQNHNSESATEGGITASDLLELRDWLRAGQAATDLTIWAVTCPGDPAEKRPSHFIAADAHEAITSYADCYRGGVTRGIEAEAVDLEELACESAAAGDDAQARDCWSARAGDQAAIRRVCLALG